MVKKEDLDFYCSFSRKELQSLCKKYGLPANRSGSDMAESLASYFEKNRFSSISFGVEFGGRQEASVATYLIPSMQPGPTTNAMGDVKKDCYKTKLATIREDYSQTARFKDSDCSTANQTHCQEPLSGLIGSPFVPKFNQSLNSKYPTANSETDCSRPREKSWLTSRPQTQKKDVNSDECPQENSSPGHSTNSHSSSFEFYVTSEEGINLCVDLNFNPSDWINKMRSDVSVCDSMRRKKSRSSIDRTFDGTDLLTESDKHMKCPSPSNLDAVQDKDGPVMEESSLSAVVKENGHAPSDNLCNGEGSLASSTIERCSRLGDDSDHCKEDAGLNVFLPDSSAPGQIISCSESCTKSCCVISLDLDCVSSPKKNLASDCVVDAADDPTNLPTSNLPIAKLSNGVSENPSPENPPKIMNPSSAKHICPGGGCSAIPSSEVKVCQTYPSDLPCKASKSLDMFDPKFTIDTKLNGCSNLTEFHPKASRSFVPSNVEEQEWSEIISG